MQPNLETEFAVTKLQIQHI